MDYLMTQVVTKENEARWVQRLFVLNESFIHCYYESAPHKQAEGANILAKIVIPIYKNDTGIKSIDQQQSDLKKSKNNRTPEGSSQIVEETKIQTRSVINDLPFKTSEVRHSGVADVTNFEFADQIDSNLNQLEMQISF